ncbi:hypothetical protein J6590_038145 [Homalodisca vitripennis]|nr:hypothetical protein J6590_038145 [Homalodisca vitripennis]
MFLFQPLYDADHILVNRDYGHGCQRFQISTCTAAGPPTSQVEDTKGLSGIQRDPRTSLERKNHEKKGVSERGRTLLSPTGHEIQNTTTLPKREKSARLCVSATGPYNQNGSCGTTDFGVQGTLLDIIQKASSQMRGGH